MRFCKVGPFYQKDFADDAVVSLGDENLTEYGNTPNRYHLGGYHYGISYLTPGMVWLKYHKPLWRKHLNLWNPKTLSWNSPETPCGQGPLIGHGGRGR